MEDRLEDLNAILQRMQQTLQCYICLDMMSNPLTTKCGHSFCSDCISQVVKGPRNSSQCPICVSNITKRSLSKNTKKIALVLAVRKVIDSIKRDCCFEVTPSKYRPRPRPTNSTEEDDSENEENDEPRRGTRKRGVPEHYIPEIHVPKPRARTTKQKVLATNGGQELSLHCEGVVGEDNGVPASNPAIIDVISKEHSYSSPTKQEPLEKPCTAAVDRGRGAKVGGSGGLAVRGQGRGTGRGGQGHGKPLTVYSGKAKKDVLSVSQCVEKTVVLPGESLPNSAGNSEPLSEKLGREKPADKVAKWLHTSSEVGFRIGASQSTSTPSTSKSSPDSIFSIFDPSKKLTQGEMSTKESTTDVRVTARGDMLSKENSLNSPSFDLRIFQKKTSVQAKTLASVPGEKNEKTESVSSSIKRIFKTKVKSPVSEVAGGPREAETQIFADCNQAKPNTSLDPYTFIPSQKTPKKMVRKRGGGRGGAKGRGASAETSKIKGQVKERGVVSKGRMRGTGRGVPGTSRANTPLNDTILTSVNTTSMKQSTPIVARRRMDRNVNISVIKPVDVYSLSQEKQVESCIVHLHEDDDSDHGIPDSCPVNTRDEFDDLVSEVKKNESVFGVSVKQPQEKEDNEEQETHLLFVTPAQEEQKPPEVSGKEKEPTKRKWGGEEREEQRRPKVQRTEEKGGERSEKGSDANSVCSESSITSQSRATKKRKTKAELTNLINVESVCNKTNKSQLSRKRKTAAERAKEEVETLCSLFEEVEDHQLKTVSLGEEEKIKKNREKEKDHILLQNISNLNDTFDNTEFNRTNLSVIEQNITMPPPKVPTGKRKVRFDQEEGDNFEEPKASTSVQPDMKASANGRRNVRYASELRVTLTDISKTMAVPITTKVAKSPGWSHVERARKDLKDPHTSLDISGGEQRSLSDTRTEGGMSMHSSTLLPSSFETNMTIEDATQEFDVEHLDSSQHKREKVIKLKRIVSELKGKVLGKGASSPKNENINPVNGDTLKNLIYPGAESEVQEPVLVQDTEPFPINENVIENEDLTLPIPLSKLYTSGASVDENINNKNHILPIPLNKISESKTLGGETLPAPLKMTLEYGLSPDENVGISDQQKDVTLVSGNDSVTLSKLSRNSCEKEAVGSSRQQRKTFCLSDKTENLGNECRLSKSSHLVPINEEGVADTVCSKDKKKPISSKDQNNLLISISEFTKMTEESSAVEENGTVLPQTKETIDQPCERERLALPANASNSSVVSKPRLPHHTMSSSPDATFTSTLSPDSKREIPRITHTQGMDSTQVLSKKKQTDDDLSNISNQSTVEKQNTSTQRQVRSDQRNDESNTVGSSSQLLSNRISSTETLKEFRVVPFKSVGPLCSKGCENAARSASFMATGDGGSCGGLGRDLCLHAVPCEMYQVLMKYMTFLTSQRHAHRECCGCGKDALGNTGYSPHKPGNEKERKDSGMAPSEVDETEYPPQAASEEELEQKYAFNKLQRTSENHSEDEVLPETEKIPSSFDTEDLLTSVLPLPDLMKDGESKVNKSSTKPGVEMREHDTEQGFCRGSKGVSTYLAHSKLKEKNLEGRQKIVTARIKRENIHETNDTKNVPNCRQAGITVSTSQVDKMDHDQNLESEEIALDPSVLRTLQGYRRGLSLKEGVEGSQMSTSLLSSVDGRWTRSMKAGQDENASKLGKKANKQSGNKKSSDENADTANEDASKLNETVAKSWDNVAKSGDSTMKLGESTCKLDNRHEKKTNGSQKTREKNTQRTDVKELVEIEKENLKNASLPSGNLQPALGRPKRKPLQSGPPVLENIMSRAITDGKNVDNTDKLEVPQIQDNQKTKPTASRNLFSPEPSVQLSKTKSSNALIIGKDLREKGPDSSSVFQEKKQAGEALVIGKDSVEEDSGSSDEARNANTSRTSKRKYRRINRPASSGSSSESSDSEPVVTNPCKRVHRAISSNSSNPGNPSSDLSNKFSNSQQSSHVPEDPNLHDLDSEEMRDLNRLDLNVWEVFGHPDQDLVDHDNDLDSVVSIEEITSQQNQEILDDPHPVSLSGMSVEEIPSTADAMRNVNLDLDIIKKSRQGTSVNKFASGDLPTSNISAESTKEDGMKLAKSEPVAIEAVTNRREVSDTSIFSKSSKKSGSTDSRTESITTASGARSFPASSQLSQTQCTTSVASTLSVDTRTLLSKVDQSLSRAEQLLNKDNDLFEDISTPQDERDHQGEKSNNKNTWNKGDGSEDSDPGDLNSADEGDTASHSSAHSSQSEAVSTQRQQQVKNEVEQLKARVRELEAAMRKKEKVEEAELAKMVKVAEEVEEMEASELQKGEREELSPTCPMVDTDDETEEIFSSLPDFRDSQLASVLEQHEEDEMFKKPVGPAPRSSPKKQVSLARPSSPPVSPPPSPPSLPENLRPVRCQASGPPRLVCTGLNSSEITQVQKAITNFGPKGSSLRKAWGSEVTHVVVKSGEDRMAQRTLKYLFGVAAGCWVVDLAWAVKSLSGRKLQSEEEYEVLDCTGADGPKRSRISPKRLFGECEFFLVPPYKDVSVDQLRELMELCGGTVVDSLAKFSKKNKMKLVIIETERDHDNEDMTKKYKYVLLAHDWVLECIGMYSHICISPYIIGNPTQQHMSQSCLPLSLLKETQEL